MSTRPVVRTRFAPRLMAAALAGLLAACPAGTVQPPRPSKAPVKPAASVKATGVQGSPTPEVLPSLALLLGGAVAVDPSRLLAAGLAERGKGNVKLISDAGSGIISDSGLGLISDAGSGLIGNNAGSLISDAGSGLIGKVKNEGGAGLIGKVKDEGGAGLISNNSGNLIGKVKYTLAQAGEATGEAVPLQGIVVFAVSLKDGKVVAGPVKTNAEGHWRLGFQEAPGDNIRIMAQVFGRPAEFNYAALVAPRSAEIPVTDTSRAVAIFLIQIMRARVQDGIESRKRGEPFDIWYNGPSSPDAAGFFEAMNGSIGMMTPTVATQVDKEGQGALLFAEKILSFADLSKQHYKDLHAVTEDVRAYGATLKAGEGAKLMEDYVTLTAQRHPSERLPTLLASYGMPAAQIQDITNRYVRAGDEVFLDLAAIAKDNLGAVLEPFFDVGK